MVAKTRYDRTAAGIDHALAYDRHEARRHGRDPPVDDTKVAPGQIHFGAADQHGSPPPRKRALLAPIGSATPRGCGSE